MLSSVAYMASSGKSNPPGGIDRVGGPTDGIGAIGPGVAEADAIDRVDEVGGVSEVDALGEVKATEAAEVQAVSGVATTASASAADTVAQVAAALKAGKLSVAEAVDRLIDDAVSKQVGRAIEPGSELEARLRRVLRDYAGADPLISAKIRRLEGRRRGS